MKILNELYKLQDKEYAKFQIKLTPEVDKNLFIGVRIPEAKKLAKKLTKEPNTNIFLDTLPHKYFEENILHGILISEENNYEKCIDRLNKFLPYIDNWAVCDIISPKIFKKNKPILISEIYTWTKSKEIYTARFGLKMLMTHYLDDDFKMEYLKLASSIHSNEYYLNMMIAWFFATALAKKWDESIIYLEEKKLDKWVHNKTIQKARESRRITKEQKEYLTTLKIK